MKTNHIYLPGLNGLRAIAAISVLIGHITSTTFVNSQFGLPTISIGEHGVTLFFVISGFLITFLLLKEKNFSNNIDIKKFYIRRVLRIWPIYYLFIILGLLLSFFINDISDIQSFNTFWYIFLSANIALILNETVRFIIHYWSIGVEEQFYLIWPWFIKLEIKRRISNTLIIIFVFFAIKSFFWLFMGNNFLIYKFMNTTRFHCMLIGAVGAMLYFNKSKYFIKISSNKIIQVFSWFSFIIMFVGFYVPPAPIASEIISLFSLLLIMGQIDLDRRLVNLDIKLFDFIGKISYGIYVIHPLIIILFSLIYKDLQLPYFIKTFVVYSSIITLTIIIAYIVYTYFEKPFLKLKSKFTVVESQNSKSNDL